MSEPEITFGQDMRVTNRDTGETVVFKNKAEGRMLTIESERGDFTLTFDQTDQEATADALEAVEAYVKRTIPLERVLQ